MHWMRYDKSGLPEAGACIYCGVAHRTLPRFANKTRAQVKIELRDPQMQSSWGDSREDVVDKYSNGCTARGILEPVIKVKVSSKSYSKIKGPKKVFIELNVYKTKYGPPESRGVQTTFKDIKGVRTEGVMVLEGEKGVYEVESGDEDAVEMEQMLDDGNFVLEKGQQAHLFNNLQSDMASSSSLSISRAELDRIANGAADGRTVRVVFPVWLVMF